MMDKFFPTVEAAVDLLKRTQDILSESNLQQHKCVKLTLRFRVSVLSRQVVRSVF